jgi:hypothetical protein
MDVIIFRVKNKKMFLVKKKLFFLFIKMVHKRSQNKLQERKNKSFSNNKRKREKVSGHLNRLEWLLSLPVVFQIFLDR